MGKSELPKEWDINKKVAISILQKEMVSYEFFENLLILGITVNYDGKSIRVATQIDWWWVQQGTKDQVKSLINKSVVQLKRRIRERTKK